MHELVKTFVEDAGNTAQSFGLGRVVGQIYAYLYFSAAPRGLQDMQDNLHISKGSASMCVRQLEGWGAVKKVWVKGDRRDYYEANDWFGKVLKNVLADVANKRFSDRDSLYAAAETQLAELDGSPETAFLRERIAHLKTFEEKARRVWNNPLIKALLG
jgi:HTH-type transcriptional regulator, glycine betaine synthesis regulator